jgi:TPR repeat protein
MAKATTVQPAPARRRRLHPLLPAALLAVTVAAAGVAGAAAWREKSEARRVQLMEWRNLAVAAEDATALGALRAAALTGEVAAQAALGEALWSRPAADLHAQGERWLRQAAASGDARAHFLLGKAALLGSPALATGRAAPDPAFTQAWHHLGLAAEAGHSGAAYYLGLLHRGGYGRPSDAAAAARWFTAAAEGGVPQAMFMLANAYRDGAGVPRDDARAVAWYEAAAEREHPESIQALAMAYRHGELGLDPDERSFRLHLAETAHALKHPALKP